jgi:O-glycosyl hydrolase
MRKDFVGLMLTRLLRGIGCGVVIVVIGLAGRLTTYADSTIVVDGAVAHQVIDGFGASDAFQMGAAIRGTQGDSLTAVQTQQIMDLLFSTTKGAGLSIVRHEIGSATTGIQGDNQPSIEPDNPGSSTATPKYNWRATDSRLDGDQVWFSKSAMTYGKITFIADAWSAPAYMKTNNALQGGGYLCGSPNQTCASGDWRQAYATYLTQYAKFYHEAGIDLAYIGYINEPEYSPSTYTGMNFDATNLPNSNGARGTVDSAVPQNIDFIKNYLGPTLAASGLNTKVSCCDSTSWDNASIYAIGILKDADAKKYLGLVTGHAYYSSPNGLASRPIAAAASAMLHAWETETSTFDTFTAAWDDYSDGAGFQWGQNIWESLVKGNANAYLYWWFANVKQSNPDNEGLIRIDGGDYTVTKRLWAFANYSRFIRPGAVRIDAKTGDSALYVSAFKNVDGSYAIVVLNANGKDTPVSISLKNVSGTVAVPYLTNATNDLAAQASVSISGGTLSVTIPRRSLITYAIGAGSGTQTSTQAATMSATP